MEFPLTPEHFQLNELTPFFQNKALIWNAPLFPSHSRAPSVMCFFLENSEVSQIQNKDVGGAAAAWLTHTRAYVLQSERLWATPFHLVLSGLMRASCLPGSAAAAVWWVASLWNGSLLSSHQAICCSFHFYTCAKLKGKTSQNVFFFLTQSESGTSSTVGWTIQLNLM